MVAVLMILFPFVVSAQTGSQTCLSSGYTIEAINGIFTDEAHAGDNKVALQKYFPKTYHNEPLTIDFLLNQTHKALDLTDVAIQKTFEGVDMWDTDFLKILTDASAQVKTQKLLIVSHSQGNFYGNNFYKVVTDDGDVSKNSIGVYGVASPASSVAGEGRHLTSSTDKVIAFLVGNMLPGTIAPTNDTIGYKWADDPMGHDFAKVYLEYRPQKIIDDIKWSLDKLSLDPTRSENTPCINPPKELSTLVKIVKPVVYSADFAIATGSVGLTIIKNGINSVNLAISNVENRFFFAIGATLFSFVMAPADVTNNSASVILATQVTPTPVVANSKSLAAVNNPTSTVNKAETTPANPIPKAKLSPPKLVFVGIPSTGSSFGSGEPAQVLAVQVIIPETNEATTTGEVVLRTTGRALDAPVVSAPQCAQSLATDGCLLATTTVHFEWPAVAGADHYLINKNSTFATTTDTALDITIKDFSDYTFEVVAVDADGQPSDTSTQVISVATIPIAINEIAWMGTVASPNDEWFEIKNNTSRTIDLSQWEFSAKNNSPRVVLKGEILSHAYIIFERTDDTAVKDVKAHATTTGAFDNTKGDQLSLSRDSVIFDQTPDGAWVAGYNSTTSRQTMERFSSRELGIDPANWGTNLGYIKNGTDAKDNPIEGTPGEQNSVSTLINKGQDITSDFTLTADEEQYVVPNSVWVDASSTLTIEPGVTISFLDDSSEYFGYIVVNGEIDARGTTEKPIVFNSFSEKQAGVLYIDNATGTSTFEYTSFENIARAIDIRGGTLEISDSNFINTNGGVESYGPETEVLIENTHFESSTSDTIGAYGSTVRISSSTITNQLDGDAIGIYSGGSLAMSSSTIDGVVDGDGIYAYDSAIFIASSTVRNTENTAISLAYSTTTISNTVVQGGELNDWTIGIEVYHGTATITDTTVSGFNEVSGIGVSEPTFPVVISSGEISGNAMGIEMYPADSVVISGVSMHDNVEDVVVWTD